MSSVMVDQYHSSEVKFCLCSPCPSGAELLWHSLSTRSTSASVQSMHLLLPLPVYSKSCDKSSASQGMHSAMTGIQLPYDWLCRRLQAWDKSFDDVAILAQGDSWTLEYFIYDIHDAQKSSNIISATANSAFWMCTPRPAASAEHVSTESDSSARTLTIVA